MKKQFPGNFFYISATIADFCK